MITPETSPLYYEQKISDCLAIDREILRTIRKDALKKNDDFAQIGREIVLSATGLLKVIGFLRGQGSALPEDADFTSCMLPLPVAKKEPAGPAGAVQMAVIRCYPNNRLLLCQDPAGTPVNVRVKTNANFKPGMPLQARWDEQQRSYVMEGRCPRYPGRY